jgi:hypothetical protein
MSGSAAYKPSSLEDVRKNWIECFLRLFSKKIVMEKEVNSSFEKEYGIRLPEEMMFHYVSQLEDAYLITRSNRLNIENGRSEECYELTFFGHERLDLLREIRKKEKMKGLKN